MIAFFVIFFRERPFPGLFLACCSLSPFPSSPLVVRGRRGISLFPDFPSSPSSFPSPFPVPHPTAPAQSSASTVNLGPYVHSRGRQSGVPAACPARPLFLPRYSTLPGTGGWAPKRTPLCLPREGSGRSWTRWGPARGRKEHKIRLRRSWSKIVVGCTESPGLLCVVVLRVPCLRGDGP